MSESMLQIYKRGQGKYTRLITFVSVVIVGVIGAAGLSEKLGVYGLTRPPLVRFGVPTLLVAGLAAMMLWIVNRPKSADFLIATEGEMKKVSWSSRKEIVGSTKVVIVTTFILAFLLFGIDLLFTVAFRYMRITGV